MKGFTVTLAEFNFRALNAQYDDKVIKRVVYNRAFFDAADLSEDPNKPDYEKEK